MRYFIGCLISGEIRSYQKKLIDGICNRFDVRNLNTYAPAHFTLKSPFVGNISCVENLLERFCKEQSACDIRFSQIGTFGKQIIFLDGAYSNQAEKIFRDLISELRKFDWMQFRNYELTDANFHSTLCRAKDEKQFEKIMEFLKNEKFCFDFKFDNITIFQNAGEKWEVCRKFKFANLS